MKDIYSGGRGEDILYIYFLILKNLANSLWIFRAPPSPYCTKMQNALLVFFRLLFVGSRNVLATFFWEQGRVGPPSSLLFFNTYPFSPQLRCNLPGTQKSYLLYTLNPRGTRCQEDAAMMNFVLQGTFSEAEFFVQTHYLEGRPCAEKLFWEVGNKLSFLI